MLSVFFPHLLDLLGVLAAHLFGGEGTDLIFLDEEFFSNSIETLYKFGRFVGSLGFEVLFSDLLPLFGVPFITSWWGWWWWWSTSLLPGVGAFRSMLFEPVKLVLQFGRNMDVEILLRCQLLESALGS